jgi:hypothetical protein
MTQQEESGIKLIIIQQSIKLRSFDSALDIQRFKTIDELGHMNLCKVRSNFYFIDISESDIRLFIRKFFEA